MNGWLLLIPFFAVRFLLPAGLNRHALQRAAYFAPMQGKERMAYYMYQISNAGLFFYLFFLNVKVSVSICFFLGVFFLSGRSFHMCGFRRSLLFSRQKRS